MTKQDALNRLKELEPIQKELNEYMSNNNLSWQNLQDRENDKKVKLAYEIWLEVKELGKALFN